MPLASVFDISQCEILEDGTGSFRLCSRVVEVRKSSMGIIRPARRGLPGSERGILQSIGDGKRDFI